MNHEHTGEEGKSCCRGGHWACKIGAAIILLAIGAVGGFFCGRSCATGSCPLFHHGSSAPMQAPVQPPAK